MGLLPETQAANIISPMMYAARESGLAVPPTISPRAAKSCILSKVTLQEVKTLTYEDIHEASRIAQSHKDRTVPRFRWWDLGDALAAKKENLDNEEKATEQADAEANPIVKNLAWKMIPGHLDSEFAYKWRKKHNARQHRRIIDWAIKRKGPMSEIKAYLLLARTVREQKC